MNIKLTDLINNSNFKEYHFIVDARIFTEGTVIAKEIGTNKKGTSTLMFTFNKPDENNVGWKYYDLGKCINLITPRANTVAKYIEKSKLFEFYNFEVDFANQAAYIQLIRREI